MNRCFYESMHGKPPYCDGACKKGKCNYCPYYYEDKVWNIMFDWKKEAGVTSPIVWKWNNKRNKVCLYTTRPGLLIGRGGEMYQKYVRLLSEANPVKFKENGVDIIECDDGIGD